MTLDKKELKKAFNSIPKTRQDQYVDQRSYIIGAMYYGCGMTEQAVADFLNTCRNRVHHNKINALKFKDDQSFVTNTDALKKKFPYEVKVRLKKNVMAKRIISLHSIFGKKSGYRLALDEKLCKDLEKYSRVCGTRNAESTIRAVLTKFFEEWEE
jgi:hypothetical protein